MTETLFHAYMPLLLWTGLGLVLFRFLPHTLPRLLGRGLYWVGVPVEIFALARQTDFSDLVWLSPIFTVIALLVGMSLALLSLWGLNQLTQENSTEAPLPGESRRLYWLFPQERPRCGSFVLSSMLGNTGFIGLAIAPSFISSSHLSWVVFYGVAHNLLGTYGLGVLLSSYFGRSASENHWWIQLRDILSVPSLWAFVWGVFSRAVAFPASIESGLQSAIWVVIPCAFLLIGMRLSQLQGLKSLQTSLIPVILKVLVSPAIVGLSATLMGFGGESRLALVLMSGMPTAFATLILAEEYELDRELISSSIALSTVVLLPVIPLWLTLFG